MYLLLVSLVAVALNNAEKIENLQSSSSSVTIPIILSNTNGNKKNDKVSLYQRNGDLKMSSLLNLLGLHKIHYNDIYSPQSNVHGQPFWAQFGINKQLHFVSNGISRPLFSSYPLFFSTRNLHNIQQRKSIYTNFNEFPHFSYEHGFNSNLTKPMYKNNPGYMNLAKRFTNKELQNLFSNDELNQELNHNRPNYIYNMGLFKGNKRYVLKI